MSGTSLSPSWLTTVGPFSRRLPSLVRSVAFWTAALFPFVALPLAALDPSRLVDFRLLGAMVSINVLAFVVGHDYGLPDGDAETVPTERPR